MAESNQLTEREKIIDEIQRLNDAEGTTPGQAHFKTETGIPDYHWKKFWRTWPEAVEEAGLEPNERKIRIDEQKLVTMLIDLALEVKRFPTQDDIKFKRNNDKEFASESTFSKNLGTKINRAKKVLEYCEDKGEMEEVVSWCSNVIQKQESSSHKEPSNDDKGYGFVYLCKHGNQQAYKIGETTDVERRMKELNAGTPEEIKLIHTIKTDDRKGVEKYWHKRCKIKIKKNKNEWFRLTPADIKAFKKWKRIY